MKAIGTEVFMDFNAFSEKIATTAKALKLDAKATTLNAIARAMSTTDPEAMPVVKKRHKVGSKEVESLVDTFGIDEKRLADYGFFPGEKGSYVCQYIEYEPDSDLRDTEKIPVKEDIYAYFQREVRPYVADAWINLPPTKIGCEISFNKYFYKPVPLRTLEENERDISATSSNSTAKAKGLSSHCLISCNAMAKQETLTYIPPFAVSAEAINLIAEISAQIERYAIRLEQEDGVRLRRANRIKTIHSSLAIEGNTLSENEVRDIIELDRQSQGFIQSLFNLM